jgi:hypothetical protein
MSPFYCPSVVQQLCLHRSAHIVRRIESHIGHLLLCLLSRGGTDRVRARARGMPLRRQVATPFVLRAWCLDQT